MLSKVVIEDRVFQALADPSRRAIFVSLTRGEAAVKDLTSRLDISQPVFLLMFSGLYMFVQPYAARRRARRLD